MADNTLDLPYEPSDGEITLSDALISGGVVFISATLETDEGTKPVLLFRFFAPDGQLYQPIALIMDADQMAKLPGRIGEAAEAAVAAAGGA
ncbi:MAG TPA: hypothetical protein VGK54_13730 [Chloroflexota bacterium]|jgi:hypothetical protein